MRCAAGPKPAARHDTALSTVTRVRAGADGRLTAECRLCRVLLDQAEGVDVERALAAFDSCHAASARTHDGAVPPGWLLAPRRPA